MNNQKQLVKPDQFKQILIGLHAGLSEILPESLSYIQSCGDSKRASLKVALKKLNAQIIKKQKQNDPQLEGLEWEAVFNRACIPTNLKFLEALNNKTSKGTVAFLERYHCFSQKPKLEQEAIIKEALTIQFPEYEDFFGVKSKLFSPVFMGKSSEEAANFEALFVMEVLAVFIGLGINLISAVENITVALLAIIQFIVLLILVIIAYIDCDKN